MPDPPSRKELQRRVQELEALKSQLRAAERSLRRSEERFSAFLYNSPVGAGIWDREFRYLYLNEVLQKINGPDMEAHLGHTVAEVLPKAAPIIEPLFEQILATCQPQLNLELSGEVPSAPGKLRHYLVSYFPMAIMDGQPQYIGGVVVDITDRKHAEAALTRSETKFRTLFENMAQGVFYQQADGCLSDANSAALEMFGLTRDEFLGRTSKDPRWRVVTEAGRELPGEQHPSMVALKTGKAVRDVILGVFNPRVADMVWLSVNAIPQFEADATSPHQVFVTLHDITERKRVEAERDQLRDQFNQAQKMQSIGVLAGGIAHDFNNILASIIGFTELSLDEIAKDSAVADHLQEIYAAGTRARDLVRQILTFARQSDASNTPVEVKAVAEEALALIRSSIPTSIDLRHRLDSRAKVLANESQMHQVFMNLCANAAQDMEPRGGTLTVHLRDTAAADLPEALLDDPDTRRWLVVTITDTGPGIAPHLLGTIFEPYFTTKKPGEGTGMGLAVVHGIVEAWGGKIDVISKMGEGTTFALYLPIAPRKQPQAPPEAADTASIPTGSERILVVDDETPITRMVKLILKRLGYRVTVRNGSEEALELFRADPTAFDLVLTDMTMPKMTGDRLAAKMMHLRPDLPVILCTGYNRLISEHAALAMGIRAFVVKPIARAELATTVRRVLDQPAPTL